MTEFSNKFILSSYRLTDLFCYPKFCNNDYYNRMGEMRSLSIKYVILEGNTTLNNNHILGKGSEGLVLKVQDINDKIKAVKIRRTDSNRIDVKNEYYLYQHVNKYDIGPKVHLYTRNILLMEYLEGLSAKNWFMSFNSDTTILRNVIINILNQCYRLDKIGIDHGQLNKLDNHVIISSDGSKCTIVDFESASSIRRVNNVTSALQGLLFNGIISRQINNFINFEKNGHNILGKLKAYKSDKSRENFDSIVALI